MGIRQFLKHRAATRLARHRWADAETLQDLCDLTTQWLTGTLAAHPWYRDNGAIAAMPEHIDTLSALGHAGFLVTDARPTRTNILANGHPVTQTARIWGVVDDAGFDWLNSIHGSNGNTWHLGEDISYRLGEASVIYEWCSEATVGILCRAHRVVIAAPEGTDAETQCDMWDWVGAAARRRARQSLREETIPIMFGPDAEGGQG